MVHVRLSFSPNYRVLQMKPVLSTILSTLSSFRRESTPVSFGDLAAQWWDSQGPMKPLHNINPTRMRYVKQILCRHLGRDDAAHKPLSGLRILDIGCGGGLVSEALTRLGAEVTGIDTSAELIAVAQDHAAQQDLTIAYEAVLSSELVARGLTFDAVLALEVIEHVDDPQALLQDMRQLLKPDGLAIVSTLNRTMASFMGGIVAAEYVLRWVPRGTHQWSQFIKPSDLAEMGHDSGLQATDTMGLHYDMLTRTFNLQTDKIDINYFMAFQHAA
jgi:2-polyprenyl-6-hydroxyphenyl methylase/3-demethylubiquinone-9 3-methyltransferase